MTMNMVMVMVLMVMPVVMMMVAIIIKVSDDDYSSGGAAAANSNDENSDDNGFCGDGHDGANDDEDYTNSAIDENNTELQKMLMPGMVMILRPMEV